MDTSAERSSEYPASNTVVNTIRCVLVMDSDRAPIWYAIVRKRRSTRVRRYVRIAELLHEMPKVTIAAINGACAGAGLAVACAADLRYAAASAVFATAFLRAGLSGDFGGPWTLTRLVGAAKARELYMLRARFACTEAERSGLDPKTLPHAPLPPHVRRFSAILHASAP